MEDDMPEDRPDIYEYFGTYPQFEARRLLNAFIGEEIQYTLNPDTRGIADMFAAVAAAGGTFGSGAGVAIGIHIDDVKRAAAIRQRVLKIVV